MLARMSTTALHFHNVTKRYPHQLALSDLNLSVQAGEFFGLVGVNGADKTTLIKSLLDFCDIDSARQDIILQYPHAARRGGAVRPHRNSARR